MKFSDKATPEELAEFYKLDDSAVPKDRPYAWLMFVSTFDGRGTFREPGAFGGDLVAMQHLKGRPEAVGAYNDARLLQMGWAMSDAVLGSANIIETEKGQLWKPWDQDILDYRRDVLKKPGEPIKVILTNKGEAPLEEKMITYDGHKVLIFTTKAGSDNLLRQADGIEKTTGTNPLKRIKVHVQDVPSVDPVYVARVLRGEHGVRYLDVTGGPTIAGAFWKAKLIDEYRITFAPQVIGDRSAAGENRPSPIAGLSLGPENSSILDSVEVGQTGGHIYARTRVSYRH